MTHFGEIISLIVAVSWTTTALFASEASHRLGSMSVNVIRLVAASLFLSIILWITIGYPYPVYADGKTWLYLSLSALVGYIFGDYCLFNSYIVIGPKIGQLFMTLAPPIAAIAGWILLGEQMRWQSWIAMAVTISGIAITIISKGGGDQKMRLNIPFKGVLLGIGAGLGQGVGLVLSKIGMEYYQNALPEQTPQFMDTMLPFASTMIRAIIGGLGFVAIIALQRRIPHFIKGLQDHKGVKYAIYATLFGPVLGVSLSLMAVRYTNAGIASTLMALTPVLILLPYSLIYRQKLEIKEVIGASISMAGVAMFFLL